MPHRRHLGIVLQRVVVFVDEVAAQLMRILRTGLPEKRGEVVVIRSFPSALIIDKARIAVVVEHHVTRLEVTVEETVTDGIVVVGKVLGEEPEVSLELQLMEVEFGGFQEAVLEVVQVEKHAVDIEFGLRITVGEVELAGTTYLNVRQFTDGAAQQLLLLQRITATGFAPATDGIEERGGAKIGLDIA